MKKLFNASWLLLVVFILTLVSCNEDPVIPAIEARKVDITIDVANLTGAKAEVTKQGLSKTYLGKDGTTVLDYPACTEDQSSYIEVTIDGVLYTVQFTALNGETEVLQLNADAPNIITMLEVFNSAGVPIYSMPEAGSEEVVNGGLQGVPYDLELSGFTKTKVNVDVVCWHEYSTQVLAWQWYEIKYYQIKTVCFYGDVCTKFFDDFHEEGSAYFGQEYDGYDFPAIFSLKLFSDGVKINEQNNVEWQGVGSALCLEYRDDPLADEQLTFEIWFTDPDGTGLVYSGTIEDGAFSDAGDPDSFGGEDGIFTFAIGNCDSQGNNDVDLVLPSYLPLPAQATFSLGGSAYVSGYYDLTVSGIGAGVYALTDGTFPGWCAAKHNTISLNTSYLADIYSSLDPPSKFAGVNWGALNWLVNHQGSYTNQEIQAGIWAITDGEAANSLSIDALTHSSYLPKVGEYALVIFDAVEASVDDKEFQLFVVKVDP